MLAKQTDGVTVVGRRPPALRRADVLRDIDAGLDYGNKVYYTPRSQRGSWWRSSPGSGFLP